MEGRQFVQLPEEVPSLAADACSECPGKKDVDRQGDRTMSTIKKNQMTEAAYDHALVFSE